MPGKMGQYKSKRKPPRKHSVKKKAVKKPKDGHSGGDKKQIMQYGQKMMEFGKKMLQYGRKM